MPFEDIDIGKVALLLIVATPYLDYLFGSGSFEGTVTSYVAIIAFYQVLSHESPKP